MSAEREFIKGVDKLIPRPEIALEVLTIANETECDLTSLSNRIKQDPSLLANILKLANSAYFGHMKEINSITDVVVRLGLDTIKMLAITSASVGLLKSPQEAYNLEPGSLWQHSYATAQLAAIIGKKAGSPALSSLYSSALLHDIGKIILNRHLQIETMNRGGGKATEPAAHKSFVDYENSLLHTDHAKTGRALLEEWGLPAAIANPVGLHHDAKACAKDLDASIVFLANHLTESMGIHATDPLESTTIIEEEFSAENSLPKVPGFQENMEAIITEFYEKFHQASNTLQFR